MKCYFLKKLWNGVGGKETLKFGITQFDSVRFPTRRENRELRVKEMTTAMVRTPPIINDFIG